MEGDRILVNKFIYRFTQPKRGDVIVFIYPEDKSKDFIKRLVGLPGDVVEIKGGSIYINEKPATEPIFNQIYYYNRGQLGSLGEKMVVPQGVVGAVFHVDGKISDLDELTRQIIDIEKIADGDVKVDEGIKKDLIQMKTVLEKIRSSEENDNQKGEEK